MITIFCPRCQALLLAADQCPACHWQRPSAGVKLGQPAWTVALNAKLPGRDSQPLAVGQLVFFLADDSQLFALDTRQAEVLWQRQLDPRYRRYGLAAWQGGLLLGGEFQRGFPAPPGQLLLLDLETGAELWRFPVEGVSLSVPLIDEDIAYFGVNSGWLYALDLNSRQELWRKKVDHPWSWAPVAPLLMPGGLLVLPGRANHLVALNAKTGKLAWTFSGSGWFASAPVGQEELVYARCWDGHIYALEAATGREIWRHKAARGYSSDLFAAGQYLYIGAKDYRGGAAQGARAYALYVLNAQTGQRTCRIEVNGHIFARPVATDRAVFFATDDKTSAIPSQGTLYAFDAAGQQPLWAPLVVQERFQSELLLVDHLLIAGTRQGEIYGVPWTTTETVDRSPQDYAAEGQWEKAAIAYALAHQYQPAAEIYANLGRYIAAAKLYEEERAWGRAAAMLEQQVKQELDQAGGPRYLANPTQVETWLGQAIEHYEQEADYETNEDNRRTHYDAADRCRTLLMRLRREPLLGLTLVADRLLYDQGNLVHYTLENEGWGAAQNVTLRVSGPHLREDADLDLGTLYRGRKQQGVITIVPTVIGQIMLQIDLRGQSKRGEFRQRLTHTAMVVRQSGQADPGVTVDVKIGHVVDPQQLGQQRRTKRSLALRQQLEIHYNNLHKLQQQAAIYGAGQAPLELQNKIEIEQQAIDKIEDELVALQAD